jgi:predicted Ser/Thr protein kinase
MKVLGPGSRIGRFEVVRLLGEGAMGVVYLAQDPHIERPVAVKTLRSDGDRERAAEIESRFLKEAKLSGRLQHPSIVTIYEFGRDGDTVYIAMEYVDGQSLSRFVAGRPSLTVSERVALVRDVARALQHAHERGVVHRDIKPGNILVTKDRSVKVADFGIGKLLSGASTDLTRTGTMIGSPAYMSPEQIRGEKIDGRSDFFSLGVVLFELLTGARPFPGDSITTLVYQILHTEPRDPLSLKADLAPAAREVFARLLAKQPADRPGNSNEFIREIDRLATEFAETQVTAPPIPVAARGASATAAAPSPAGKERSTVPLFAVAAVLVAAALLLFVWRTTDRSRNPSTAVVTPASAVTQAIRPGSTIPPPEVPTALPTRGPAEAADTMIVGAPRLAPTTTRPARPTPLPKPPTEAPQVAAVLPAPETSAAKPAEERPASKPPASLEPADRAYRTRRSARFSGASPDQARLFVDGKYVGIVDDWDNHGGGKDLEFTNGPHRVRMELPGYRTLEIDLNVTPSAEEEVVTIEDELKRISKVPYPKIGPTVNGHTRGAVQLEVDPPEAELSEGEKKIGFAAQFGASSPLKLSGPMVHELVLSAPGYESRTVRVLVSRNSGNDLARIKVKLKKTS